MTISEMQRAIAQELGTCVGMDEARAMASVILEDVKGYKPIDIALYGYRELTPETEQKINGIVEKVKGGMPLQYAIGSAKFHGRDFKVNTDTLIPRPETSQLIDIIEKDYGGSRDLNILDVGTGTGCIAISLALDLPFSKVLGIDISQEAVDTAQENAKMLKANEAKFLIGNALSLNMSGEWDIIVSNPPYVLESEKPDMDHRVIDYEPALALFVPDSDPLKFYKPIAEYAAEHLTAKGALYFEINPLCERRMKEMLSRVGFKNVDIIRDYKGNYRFAKATLF